MISTERHVSYAMGFLGLRMLDEALGELEAVSFDDRFLPSLLTARIELYTAAQQWDLAEGVARTLLCKQPENAEAWISWAFALREQGKVAEALATLLDAEPLHGKASSNIHYNLACYYSLLGDQEKANERLTRAFRMDPSWKAEAIDDADLKPLWATNGAMR